MCGWALESGFDCDFALGAPKHRGGEAHALLTYFLNIFVSLDFSGHGASYLLTYRVQVQATFHAGMGYFFNQSTCDYPFPSFPFLSFFLYVYPLGMDFDSLAFLQQTIIKLIWELAVYSGWTHHLVGALPAGFFCGRFGTDLPISAGLVFRG